MTLLFAVKIVLHRLLVVLLKIKALLLNVNVVV